MITNKKKEHFNQQLSFIESKAKDLQTRGKMTASDKAFKFYEDLRTLAENYFSNPNKENYDLFKSRAQEKIKDSLTELNKHRGWNHILANLGLAILGFGALYLIAVVKNRALFFNQTQSAKILEEFDSQLNNDLFKITH